MVLWRLSRNVRKLGILLITILQGIFHVREFILAVEIVQITLTYCSLRNTFNLASVTNYLNNCLNTLLEVLHWTSSFKYYYFTIFLCQTYSSFEFIKTHTQNITAYYNEELTEFLKGWVCFYFYLSVLENKHIKKYIQKFCLINT